MTGPTVSGFGSRDGFEERLKQVMADILDLDPASIDESTCTDGVESWDSLAHINLCLALEQEFAVSFEVAEIESMLSYADLVDVLQRKL